MRLLTVCLYVFEIGKICKGAYKCMLGTREHLNSDVGPEHSDLHVEQPAPKRQRQFMHPMFLAEQSMPVTPPVQHAEKQLPLSTQQPFISAASQVPPQSISAQASFMPSTSQITPLPPIPTQHQQKPLPWLKRRQKQKTSKTRGKRLRRLVIVCSILTIITVIFFSSGNGQAGAWTADALRVVFGPTITAQIESWYLGLSDTTHQVQYHLSGQQVAAPWTEGSTPPNIPTAPPTKSTLAPMPLTRIPPTVTPALAGEGVWLAQGTAPAPYNYLPLDAKTFIRPDLSHPYAIVTLLQFDERFFRLHMVAGTIEPGGPRGVYGPGVIPAPDQKGNALLAAFNGGFKYADGQYGLKTNGVIYVPPQPGAATLALTKKGQILLGSWGVHPLLNSANSDLVAWRQNASLLINNGVINPLTQDGAAWGGTILNRAYTWRSGIGITAHGTLIYAAGDALTALTLGEALKAAGAVMAMQTDINPFWVRAFLYNRTSHGQRNVLKLNPAMQGDGSEYLYGTQRDFFYLTRFAPPPPPTTPTQRYETNSQ